MFSRSHLVDLAHGSITDAMERYSNGHFEFTIDFMAGDCFDVRSASVSDLTG